MKETFQKFQEEGKKERKIEKEQGAGMARRDFLKLLGAAAGVFAEKGFHGIASAGERSEEERAEKKESPEKKKSKETPSFAEQWDHLVRAAVENLNTRPGLFWKEKNAKEAKEALPAFDIRKFLDSLAENSGMNPEEISGRLERLFIEPPDPYRSFHTGSMVPEDRSITIHLSPIFYKKGALDREEFFSTIRHELTHALSVDYQTSQINRMVPWMNPQNPFLIFISPSFYEGATELIALRASPEKKYNKDEIRSYSAGITLSAYVIAHLAGEREFTRSYLKKDPAFLARALDRKVGAGAALALTEPLHIQASLRKEGNLDILHNIFKYDYVYDLARVKEILRNAWEDGLEEMVAWQMDGGMKITMDLFGMFDDITGQRFFSVTAAAEGPEITRFAKNPVRERSGDISSVELPRHHVSVAMRQTSMGEKERNENIRFAAETLRNVLGDPDPEAYREQSLLILGLPSEVKNRLNALNRIDDPFSQEFQDTWISLQDALGDFITSAVKEVYEQAGVAEDQYIPYPFSPLSSAQ